MTQTLKNPTHPLARLTTDNKAHLRPASSYENNQPRRGRVTALGNVEHNDHMEARAAARGSPLDTGLYFDTKEVRADTVKSRNQSPGHASNVSSALAAQRVSLFCFFSCPLDKASRKSRYNIKKKRNTLHSRRTLLSLSLSLSSFSSRLP